MIRIDLTEQEARQLLSLRELCITDDLLDLQSYGGRKRGDLISDSWNALDVIERHLILPND